MSVHKPASIFNNVDFHAQTKMHVVRHPGSKWTLSYSICGQYYFTITRFIHRTNTTPVQCKKQHSGHKSTQFTRTKDRDLALFVFRSVDLGYQLSKMEPDGHPKAFPLCITREVFHPSSIVASEAFHHAIGPRSEAPLQGRC